MKDLIKDLKKLEKSNLSEDFKDKVLVKLVDSYISEKKEFSLNNVMPSVFWPLGGSISCGTKSKGYNCNSQKSD